MFNDFKDFFPIVLESLKETFKPVSFSWFLIPIRNKSADRKRFFLNKSTAFWSGLKIYFFHLFSPKKKTLLSFFLLITVLELRVHAAK